MTVGPSAAVSLQAPASWPGRKGEICRALRAWRDDHGEQARACYPDIPRRISGDSLGELLPERGFNVARALGGETQEEAEAKARALLDGPHLSEGWYKFYDDSSEAEKIWEVRKAGLAATAQPPTCKACKTECPVNADTATCKAKFHAAFIANGFSCREQARQSGGRVPATLPEMLQERLARSGR